MEKLRAAVLGLGYAGLNHALAYAGNPDVELVAVATRSEERLQHALTQLPSGVEGTADYASLAVRADIDIVSVATPDHLHAGLAVAALEAGKHVFCEKPLATSLDDCRRIVAAADSAGTKFIAGQILRFAPFFNSLKRIYDDGDLGTAFLVEADYLHDIGPFLQTPGWRTDPSAPQNMVLGGGCHPVDLLRWFCGEVTEVHAYANKIAMPDQPFPHDCIVMTMTFASGAIGKVIVSVGCKRPYLLNFAIYGTRGTLHNTRLYLDKISGLTNFMEMPLATPEEFPHYDLEIAELVRAIREDEPTRIDAREGARSVAVCLAAIESIATGRAVAVPAV